MNREHSSIQIVPFEESHAEAFYRLNLEWLEAFELLEPADLKQLEAPYRSIIAPGGKILIALEDGQVIGTCAVIRGHGETVELAKLAVSPRAQGRGLGRLLTLTALDAARRMGARRVLLVSNKRLAAAIRLYESLGFQHVALPENPEYVSVDVCMVLELAPERESAADP